MKPTRTLLLLAVATLMVTGCDIGELVAGERGSSEEGATTEAGEEPPAESRDEAATEDEAGEPADEGDGSPATGEEGEVQPDAESALESGGGTDLATGGSTTPQDVDLDLVQRHPGGTVLSVSRMRFEGNTILITGEIVNGSTRDVRINVSGGSRLRLEDDRGNTYNFVVPEGTDGNIPLPQGESIGGDFAFLGPLDRQATEVVVIANQYSPVDLPIDPEVLFEGTSSPEFALEGLELEW